MNNSPQKRLRAISPVIATIGLIIVATAAAVIANSQLIQKTVVAARPTGDAIQIIDMFMVKISNTNAHLHVEYRISPDWTAASATFKDGVGNIVTFSLSPNSTTSDMPLNAVVTVGQKYNIAFDVEGPNGSATVTKVVFVR